jgi:hypothetical protein
MGIQRPVQLVTSVRADGPSAIGWLRPLILLPPATAMGLITAQLDAMLAHELAHIRRHDYLVKPAAPENRNLGGMAAALVFLPGGAVRGTSVPLRFVITRACNIQLRHLEGESDLLNE